jgi:hypothetical protein
MSCGAHRRAAINQSLTARERYASLAMSAETRSVRFAQDDNPTKNRMLASMPFS